MVIITQTGKSSGITYAYEIIYYWDKAKRQSQSKRVCIRKAAPATGEIILIRGRAKKGKSKAVKALPARTNQVSYDETKHFYYGATCLLEQFADHIGFTADLKQCFPDIYKKAFISSFYFVLEDNNSLYRFEKWDLTHKRPYGKNIVSSKITERFVAINYDWLTNFLRLQAKRRVVDEYWFYVRSSFSNYLETLSE